MILFLYVVREYCRYLLGITALTVFLFILFDFIHKTTRYFSAHNPATSDVILFYLYQSPALILQALPIASLLGSVITMVLFSRSNEITAMRAAGMGPLKIGKPIVVCALFVSLLSLAASHYVLPKTARRMHHVEKVRIEGKSSMQMVSGSQWVRDQDRFFTYRSFDPLAGQLEDVTLMSVNSTFRPTEIITAQRAIFLRDSKQWRLTEPVRSIFSANGGLESETEEKEILVTLPLDPSNLQRDRRLPNELSFTELRRVIKAGETTGGNITEYRMDFHLKIAYPFAAFVVSLIGLKFGFRSERTIETARSLLFAVAVGISYWFFLSTARALGKRGDIPVILAAWLPNIVICGIAMTMVWRGARRA